MGIALVFKTDIKWYVLYAGGGLTLAELIYMLTQLDVLTSVWTNTAASSMISL